MSESPDTWSTTAERWFENVVNVVDVVTGMLLAAFIIWLVVRMVNEWPNLNTKEPAFWMAAGLLAVGALSLAALSAILWLG